MEKAFQKTAGYSLLIGSLLIVATMVLHPSGGSIQKIQRIFNVIVGSHALAVMSLPFMAFGFYGLSVLLNTNSRVSKLGLLIILFGLTAAMLAAAINGLAIPFFLKGYEQPDKETTAQLYNIMRLGFSLNKAMDFIFIISILLAMGLWSVIILRFDKMAKWLGYYGLAVILFAVIGMLMNFNFISVAGFRIFVFCIAGWIICCGWWMIRR